MERAAISLAVAAVSPIITKLGNVVASYFGGDIKREELRHLQTIILPKILTVIKAAEKIDVATLRPWLMELQAAAYEAEDLLDMYEYKKIKHEVSPLPASFKKFKGKVKKFFAPLLLKSELKKSFEKLQESANEADKLILLLDLVNSTTQDDNTTLRRRRVTVSGLSAPVFGRDKEYNDLVNMLITNPHESSSNRRNVVIHAIHGIGGAGKTTLAQYVYNDERVGKQFDLKIWIHVSRTFDVHRITGEIIQSVENSDSPPVGNLDALHKRLKEDLKSRNFLLVLDDIWTKDEDKHLWDQLLIPLTEGGEAGSRVLITTCMKVTAQNLGVKSENIVSLAELKTKECWSIMKYYAFGDADKEIEDSQLTDVGEKILSKLKNSPLAIRLVGCLLRKSVNVDAWRRILNTDMLGETLNIVMFSFQCLPSHLQRCFAICSLYPKGYVFMSTHIPGKHFSKVDRLIQLWIAQGYVEAIGDESLEDKGRQYFDDLVSYSLFQMYSTSTTWYVIHDLVHDIAEKVSKDYCFRIKGNDPASIPATVFHLSIVKGKDKIDLHIPSVLNLSNLRTFVIFTSFELVEFNNPIEHIAEIFKKLTKLRVLQFGRCSVPELNSFLGKLKHLRCLQLPEMKELPESLGMLYNLQFLDIEESMQAEWMHTLEIGKTLKNLGKLRCLSLPYFAYSKIEGIGKLTYLQQLEIYDVIKYGGLQQLGNLQQLRGELTIERLENVKDENGATTAKLDAKSHLEKLILQWEWNRDDDDVQGIMVRDEGVLEGLKPHPNLQGLSIYNYKGTKSPSWMGILNNLISLYLSSCPNLIGIPYLPDRLKVLTIQFCPELIQMPSFPYGLEELQMDCWPGAEAFLWSAISSSSSSSSYEGDDPRGQELQSNTSSSLKSLKIWGCSGLEEKTLNGLLMKDRFSSLSSLDLRRLPLITSLCLGPHMTALEYLYIEGLEKLRSIQDMRSVRSLKKLRVYECPMLRRIGGGGENINDCRFSSILEELKIDEPLMLPVLFQQQGLNSLTQLGIYECSQDVSFTAEQEDVFLHLSSLRQLTFFLCWAMCSLPGTLESLSSLEELWIDNCPKIESLPNLPSSLKSLFMWSCRKLKEKYEAGGSLCPEIDHIPHIDIY